jgi:hypothetical protein
MSKRINNVTDINDFSDYVRRKCQCLLELVELLSIDGNLFTAKDFNDCFHEYYLTGRQERANGSPLGSSLFTAIQILAYDQQNTRESHIKQRISQFNSGRYANIESTEVMYSGNLSSKTCCQVPI